MPDSSMKHGMSLTSLRLRQPKNISRVKFDVSREWRGFAGSSIVSSGHNRWSKIKHDKGANDAVKSRERGAISKDITLTVKQWGPDPAFNPRLNQHIALAKKAGFSKTSIETAILKGQGKSASGAALEPVLLEAMLPGQVACVIDCLADNKARVLQDFRYILGRWGGRTTSTGYLFEKKGRVVFRTKDGVGLDQVLDRAIEAGATDVSIDEHGRTVVDTETGDVQAVAKTLAEAIELEVASADIIYDPKEDLMVDFPEDGSLEATKLEKLLEKVREDQAVQEIYLNAR